MRTILFICTGNTCRSPMAEAIAQDGLDRGLLGTEDRFLAASAGVAAATGQRPTAEAVKTMRDMGLALSGRSKPLTVEMIQRADVVFGMTAGHVAAARSMPGLAPEQTEKILRLDPDRDLDDPIGMGQEAYDALAKKLKELIPVRLKEAFCHENRTGV